MRFSLISVYKTHKDGKVDGSWIQDHHGTLESAIKKAQATNKVNSNALDIAIVAGVASVVPLLDNHHYLRRLEEKDATKITA